MMSRAEVEDKRASGLVLKQANPKA